MSKKIIVGLGIVFVLAVAGLFVISRTAVRKYSHENTPAVVLSKTNEDFALAKNYSSQGNYDQAKEYYQRALNTAEDQTQKGQILFNIAAVDESRGDYLAAIREFKALSADPSNYAFVRAYAVQEMGLIYYGVYNADRSALSTEIFRDPPFSGMKESGDIDLAYRRLFEYAASIYPLGSSEARIAYWYASDIGRNQQSTGNSQALSEVAIVNQSIAKAEADIKRTTNDPSAMRYIPGTYSLEAMALAKLMSIGAAESTAVEQRFQKSVQFADAFNHYGNERWRYAEFLSALYGETRAADIQNLLSVYAPAKKNTIFPPTIALLRAAISDPTLAEDKKILIKTAKIAPDFKAFLLSVGWHESDFSNG